MAFSYVNYVGDGSTRTFSVPFPYLDKSHVSATIDGVAQTFTWDTPAAIRLTTAPPNGNRLLVKRTTPETPLTIFEDGSTFAALDLNRGVLQPIYIEQEREDDNVRSIRANSVLNPLPQSVAQRANTYVGFDSAGQPTVFPTSLVPTTPIICLNDAALSGIVGAFHGQAINPLGYYTPGDLGDRELWWDSASTATDDGRTVRRPTPIPNDGTPGRWRMKLKGPIRPQQFGAKANDPTFDSLAAFQAIANCVPAPFYLSSPGIYVPPGNTFYISTNPGVVLNFAIRIEVDAGGVITTFDHSTEPNSFLFNPKCDNVHFRGPGKLLGDIYFDDDGGESTTSCIAGPNNLIRINGGFFGGQGEAAVGPRKNFTLQGMTLEGGAYCLGAFWLTDSNIAFNTFRYSYQMGCAPGGQGERLDVVFNNIEWTGREGLKIGSSNGSPFTGLHIKILGNSFIGCGMRAYPRIRVEAMDCYWTSMSGAIYAHNSFMLCAGGGLEMKCATGLSGLGGNSPIHETYENHGVNFNTGIMFNAQTALRIKHEGNPVDNQLEYIRSMEVTGNNFRWDYASKVKLLTANPVSIAVVTGNIIVTVTMANHGALVKDKVLIRGVNGIGNLPARFMNKQYVVTAVTTNTFSFHSDLDPASTGLSYTGTGGGSLVYAHVWQFNKTTCPNNPVSVDNTVTGGTLINMIVTDPGDGTTTTGTISINGPGGGTATADPVYSGGYLVGYTNLVTSGVFTNYPTVIVDSDADNPGALQAVLSFNVSLNVPNHNCGDGDTVYVSGVNAAVGGIPADVLNGRFSARVIDASHIGLKVAVNPTSVATGGGNAVQVSFEVGAHGTSSCGITFWASLRMRFKGNNLENCASGFNINLYQGSTTGATPYGASIVAPIFEGNTLYCNVGYIIQGTTTGAFLDDLHISGGRCDYWTYGIQTNGPTKIGAVRRPVIKDTTFRAVRAFRGTQQEGSNNYLDSAGILMYSWTDALIMNVDIVGNNPIFARENDGYQISNGEIINCRLNADTNPISGAECFQKNDTGVWDFHGNKCIPGTRLGTITSRSWLQHDGTHAANPARAYDNIIGFASAIPTVAGAKNDIIINTGSGTNSRWRCTVAGGTGSATWVAE